MMLSLRVLAISGIGFFTQAVPTPIAAPMALSYDDVIVMGVDGKPQVMKAADFDVLETRAAASLVSGLDKLSPAANIAQRDCDQSTEIQVLSDSEFLNWDVAISPVVSSLSGSTASVAVTDGYMIANQLQVSEGIDIGPIEEIFKISYTLTFSETWTTQQSQTMTFTVPNNTYGVIVSQPYVRRIQGNVLSGCTESPSNSTFMSDTYTSQSYGDLNWVKGVIRLCSSETYPIPYCIGEGSHS